MSRIHLRSSSVVLWLSLSAAVAASALGIGCSSSSDSGGSAGETSAGASGKAGEGSAGESSGGSGDEAGAAGESSGGSETGGTGGTGGMIGVAGDTSEAGAGGGEPVNPNQAAIDRAIALIDALPSVDRCTTCHQTSYAGLGFWPNITPDETNGIGLWSDAEITAAILEGKDPEGGDLCATMPRFDFTEAEMSDLLIYLRQLTPNAKKISGACPN